MFKLLPEPPVIQGPIRVYECHPRQVEPFAAEMRLQLAALPGPHGIAHRPRMRFAIEALCTWKGERRYHRLPGSAVVIDAEDTNQLMWLWQAVVAFLERFDGKYIAGPPAEP
jgi:hypothetical protein